ncbi:MAG TPA: metallophosphoesterase [Polyangiaceae bacterium]
MSLSDFLSHVVEAYSPEELEGAMVFAMLARPLDELIAQALRLGPYHPGKPSPWSHCFLIAEPYHGPSTKILDCTIRDAQGKVAWDTPLKEAIEIIFESTVGKGAGKIYDAVVGDYDDDRVTARGLKWLPGLSAPERVAVVSAARDLQKAGVAYDLPGLVRELIRLTLGIKLPAPQNRLFCSSYLQSIYRSGLQALGDFAPGTRTADVTPDDIWYSHKGLCLADVPEISSLHSPAVVSLYSRTGPALAASSRITPLTSAAPPSGTREEIARVLGKLESSASGKLQDYERVRDTLVHALAQLKQEGGGGLAQAALEHVDDYELSLVLSAIHAPKQPTELGPLFGRDLPGFHQYEELDPAWIASLWNRVTSDKVPFPQWQVATDLVYPIPEAARIAIAGDWGTGNDSSRQIAAEMQKLAPDYTIHLGDVYYSGTEAEERARFTDLWPAGARGAFTLNSNHEMYSGGRGYFGVALTDSKFRMQRGFSHFALTNNSWLIIGLDSAYGSSGMYANGVLNDPQISWLRALMKSGVARSAQGPKKIMLLTHHQPLELDGSQTSLLAQVRSALGQGPQRWYWGHVHTVAAFKPISIAGTELRGRLVGHGGIPYGPEPLTPALAWTESELAGDPQIPERAKNGFALLDFSEQGLKEAFYDERGALRWSEP